MTKNQYFVSVHKNKFGVDGSIKPRNDIADSLKGFVKVDVPYTEHVESIDGIIKILSTPNPMFFVQYPLYNTGLDVLHEIKNRVNNIKIFGIIHDIDSVRFHGTPFTSESPEMKDFKIMDGLYVSSKIIKQDIIKAGYDKPIIVHGPWVNKFDPFERGSILYAGNLNSEKAGFLLNDKYSTELLSVYGNVSEDIKSIKEKGFYKGITDNGVLITLGNMFNFGLVWDEGVDGATTWSQYNMVNMPAKLSLYLRAGLPVIVRKNTRASEIVVKYKLGFAIDSLEELDWIISKYNQNTEDWWKLKKNVTEAQQKIQLGQSFTTMF